MQNLIYQSFCSKDIRDNSSKMLSSNVKEVKNILQQNFERLFAK